MELKLRFDGETDDEFRRRVERTAAIARVLVRSALENVCVQNMIADASLPYTIESIQKNPPMRVEYEQAIVIADIGSCLSSAKGKNWGEGPSVMPLEPNDPVDPRRVLYLYRGNSVYNRRFVQRREMKRILGRRHRTLVTRAKRRTKREFLAEIAPDDSDVICRKLKLSPGEFWRAVQGRVFLQLPDPELQLEFDFDGKEGAVGSKA